MNALAKTAHLTPTKLRLMMIGLLGIGIFFGTIGVAYAQGAVSADDVDSKLNDFILVAAAALVFFMQAGFAFLGAGLIRSKNTVNYMTKSFLDFCIASLGFWAFGYALMMGGGAASGIIGLEGFFLLDFEDTDLVAWFFQMVFAGTAATIIAGAVAERTKINAYFAYSFIVGAVVYPIYGHWAWSDEGWLTQIGPGFADYAGSGVVHMIGGFLALAGAIVVGPRKGFREGADLKGHNMPYVVVGTFILFFGWFGFNINSDSLGLNAVNTLLAGAAGAVSAIYIAMIRTGKADIEMGAKRRSRRPRRHHRRVRLCRSLGRRRDRTPRRSHHDRRSPHHQARPKGRRPRQRDHRARHLRRVGPAGRRHLRIRKQRRRRIHRRRLRADCPADRWNACGHRLGPRRWIHPLQGHRPHHRHEGVRRRGRAGTRRPRARQVRIPRNVAPFWNISGAGVLSQRYTE